MPQKPLLFHTLLFCSMLLIGCASGGVGPRIGIDIPISGMQAEGTTGSTSSTIGFVGGASFEGLFNKHWGFRSDLQIRTVGGSTDFAGSKFYSGSTIALSGVMNTNATLLELPLIVSFQVADDDALVQPFFGIGGAVTLTASLTSTVNGTQTITSDNGTVSIPIAQSGSGGGLGRDPNIHLIFLGGIRLPVSKSWEFRAETRLNQLITDGSLSNYYAYGSGYGTVIDVTTGIPATTLSIVVGVHLRL